MALNKFMHPRNPYRDNRPDFNRLAIEDEEFRKCAQQNVMGHVTINFKDPKCLRALSCGLLKHDFGLDVEIPLDRLIPAIPQRLNYILWLEDIFSASDGAELHGIDIGTGSSCVYPLLGAKKNKWRFIATELDPVNLTYAKQNVERNKLTESIKVIEGQTESSLRVAIKSIGDSKVHFCMCNPPFFDIGESAEVRTDRSESTSLSTASDIEKSTTGGEVEYITRIIDESLELRDRIEVYTSMIGKKSSLSLLKSHLRKCDIKNFTTSEFCQGRTMRWALAWTFNEDLKFPISYFKEETLKSRSPLLTILPSNMKVCSYDLPSLTQHMKEKIFNDLKVAHATINQDETHWVAVVTASNNTWSHSRRKRQLAMRQEAAKLQKLDPSDKNAGIEGNKEITTALPGESSADRAPEATNILIKFSLELKRTNSDIALELSLIEGEQRDMLHQIQQYMKNRLV